jgi:hypothetical protein
MDYWLFLKLLQKENINFAYPTQTRILQSKSEEIKKQVSSENLIN